MKLLLSVLLLISIIQTGMGLKCFQNDNAEECYQLLKKLNPKEEKTELDKKRLDVINCMKDNHNKVNLIECEHSRKCNKLDVKFRDENEMSFKFCDKFEYDVCQLSKLLLKGHFKHHLEYATCDDCETDQCNSDSKTDKNFFCYETHFEAVCMLEMYSLLKAAKEKKENYDKARSDALICWKREKSENLIPCPKNECSTLTLNFKDGIQAVSKVCETKSYSICKANQEFLQKGFGNLLSSAHCDFCSESHCNKDLKDTSHPEGESLMCWESRAKDNMCDYGILYQQDPDSYESDLLQCLKTAKTEELLIPCTMKDDVCLKLTMNFEDGVKSVMKSCDSISSCKNKAEDLKKFYKSELVSAICECEDGCDSNQTKPSSEIPNPPEDSEVKQNKSSSRSSSSRIHLSVSALFLLLVAFFI